MALKGEDESRVSIPHGITAGYPSLAEIHEKAGLGTHFVPTPWFLTEASLWGTLVTAFPAEQES